MWPVLAAASRRVVDEECPAADHIDTWYANNKILDRHQNTLADDVTRRHRLITSTDVDR